MNMVKKDILKSISKVDKQTIFIASVITLAIAYYINPLVDIEITEWNRTFSTAIFAGISIDKRIANFYKMFFFLVSSDFYYGYVHM